nr:methyl-CpG-binding domain-containing protein 2-like isoform X1 [Tanacetum cinerariifolium]
MGGKKPEITPTVNNQEGTIQNDQKPLEGPSVPSNGDIKENDQNAVAVSLSEDETDDEDIDDETSLIDDSHKQMVIYDPPSNGSVVIRGVQNPDPERPRSSSRRPPEVAAFTVQCANCFKWRLIPDLPKYEVIREHITDQPFLCETTRQWGREITCDDPTDIKQDGTQIWAIDKPNIAKPPPGWQRLLRLRKEGSSKFADIYYTSPTGAKLRSLPEVQKPPPQVGATIEDITKRGTSEAFKHGFDKMLSRTCHNSSTSAKESVCDYVTPRSLPQDDSSTPSKDSVCESVTPRCMSHGMLTPSTNEFVITYTQLSGKELTHKIMFFQ